MKSSLLRWGEWQRGRATSSSWSSNGAPFGMRWTMNLATSTTLDNAAARNLPVPKHAQPAGWSTRIGRTREGSKAASQGGQKLLQMVLAPSRQSEKVSARCNAQLLSRAVTGIS